MKIRSRSIRIHSAPEEVFAYMDNLGNTGMHMMKRSGMMMGSRLDLEQLSENASGPHAKFRWKGSLLGYSINFTVAVTKWIKDKEKVWETVGISKMIILKWYQMRLVISSEGENTKTELSIAYTKPDNIFFRFIAFFLAPLYADWCLKNMLQDSKRNLESGNYMMKIRI